MTNMKLLVIGLDGGDPKILMDLIKRGKMPTLSKLLENGSFGKLRTTIPPVTGSAWTSFATGKNPGKHGIFDFYRLERSTYKIRPINRTALKEKTLWEHLSENGKRTGVFFLPMTYPPKEIPNNITISGMLTPSKESQFTNPPELKKKIQELFPEFAPDILFGGGDLDQFLKESIALEKKKMEIVIKLIKENQFDFVLIWLGNVDRFGHFFWRFYDRGHPLFEERKEYAEKITWIYNKYDSYIATLFSQMGRKETNVIILSDHGFGPLKNCFYLNNWLLANGLIKLKTNRSTRLKYNLLKMGFSMGKVYRWMRHLRLDKVALMMSKEKRLDMQQKWTPYLSFIDIDWSGTKVFSRGNFGQIFINVKGRERDGCVELGEEYEKLCDEIANGLSSIKDENGNKVIGEIFRREKLYQGPYTFLAPDILFLTKELEYLTTANYEFGSSMFGEHPTGVTGTHRMNGIFLASGPIIRQSEKNLKGLNMVDVMPTILRLFDMPVPEDVDGKIITDILKNLPR